MTTIRLLPMRCAVLLILLSGCAEQSAPPTSHTAGMVPIIGTPYPAFAAATPPDLFDRPVGTRIASLPRGAELMVESIVMGPDGEVWYLVRAVDGVSGWTTSSGISLVNDPRAPTATARAAPPTAMAPLTAPPATPRPLVITGSGQGLFLRAQPGQGTIIRAYPDGASVLPLGETTQLDGRRWLKVRAPDGAEGWMAAEYLRPGS